MILRHGHNILAMFMQLVPGVAKSGPRDQARAKVILAFQGARAEQAMTRVEPLEKETPKAEQAELNNHKTEQKTTMAKQKTTTVEQKTLTAYQNTTMVEQAVLKTTVEAAVLKTTVKLKQTTERSLTASMAVTGRSENSESSSVAVKVSS